MVRCDPPPWVKPGQYILLRTTKNGCNMIMDFQDPLRMNRDAFPFSNTMLALFAAVTRFGFHLMSMWLSAMALIPVFHNPLTMMNS